MIDWLFRRSTGEAYFMCAAAIVSDRCKIFTLFLKFSNKYFFYSRVLVSAAHCFSDKFKEIHFSFSLKLYISIFREKVCQVCERKVMSPLNILLYNTINAMKLAQCWLLIAELSHYSDTTKPLTGKNWPIKAVKLSRRVFIL